MMTISRILVVPSILIRIAVSCVVSVRIVVAGVALIVGTVVSTILLVVVASAVIPVIGIIAPAIRIITTTTVRAVTSTVASAIPSTVASAISSTVASAIPSTVAGSRRVVNRRRSCHNLSIFKLRVDKVVSVVGVGFMAKGAVRRGMQRFIMLDHMLILLECFDNHLDDVVSSYFRCFVILVFLRIVDFRIDVSVVVSVRLRAVYICARNAIVLGKYSTDIGSLPAFGWGCALLTIVLGILARSIAADETLTSF